MTIARGAQGGLDMVALCYRGYSVPDQYLLNDTLDFGSVIWESLLPCQIILFYLFPVIAYADRVLMETGNEPTKMYPQECRYRSRRVLLSTAMPGSYETDFLRGL